MVYYFLLFTRLADPNKTQLLCLIVNVVCIQNFSLVRCRTLNIRGLCGYPNLYIAIILNCHQRQRFIPNFRYKR